MKMNPQAILDILIALLFAPILLGIITRTKAWFAGRLGAPLLQPYFDLWKLLQKGAVYSHTTTWVFRALPVVGLATTLTVLLMIPLRPAQALFSFPCDFIVIAYAFGLLRMFTVIAALDTGSSFEGMGASREVFFSFLAEAAFLISLGALAWSIGHLSLTSILSAVNTKTWSAHSAVFTLVTLSLLFVFLAENARIPIDDPNTHLELTMIHEVMILDHSGPDLAFILYSAALKLWVFGSILMSVLIPFRLENFWSDRFLFLGGMFLLAVFVGIIESAMARLRLFHVPRLLAGALLLSIVALMVET